MSLVNDLSNHIFICGITRSGKSTFAQAAMAEKKCGVLYLNIQGEALQGSFLRAYSNLVEFETVLELLRAGAKIDLVLRDTRKAYTITAGYIIDRLMDSEFSEDRPVYVVIDECHLLKGYSLEMARAVSTAGLKKGVRCVWVSQRPALVDKTIVTQASEHYMFQIPQYDFAYLKSKGIDADACAEIWGGNLTRRYAYFNGFELRGYAPIRI